MLRVNVPNINVFALALNFGYSDHVGFSQMVTCLFLLLCLYDRVAYGFKANFIFTGQNLEFKFLVYFSFCCCKVACY